jgi:hypothetical protein
LPEVDEAGNESPHPKLQVRAAKGQLLSQAFRLLVDDVLNGKTVNNRKDAV